MFGLSFIEVVIIGFLALVLLGPEKLPDAAKSLGKTLRDLKKHTDGLREEFEKEVGAGIWDDVTKPKLKPTLVPPAIAVAPLLPKGPPVAATRETVPGLEAALAGDEEVVPPVASTPASPTDAPEAAAPAAQAVLP